MKHSKHAKSRTANPKTASVQSVKRPINDDSDIILSKTPRGRKFYDVLTKILFGIEMLLTIALIIHATLVEIFPIQVIFILIAVLGILAGIHMWLLSGKKRKFKTKRTISLLLSIVVFVAAVFGMSYMGIINSAIGSITLGGENENDAQVGNIAKHPFLVYISGLDTRKSNEIKEHGLSDVNMIVAVNPQQKRVLMVSVPRDYYVPLEGDTSKLDKLTHAGNHGVECSMKTLESLFNIKFNYYAKVNFKSVYDIVNAVGGITVNSNYNFSSRYSYTGRTYTFQKGENQLTGDSALAFARERKSFAEGDRQRGKHQQLVIKAVVEKAISPSMLLPDKINSLLKSISANTKTNFAQSEIKKLISYQIQTANKSWQFENMSVDGTGATKITDSIPSTPVYVMIPDMETVEAASAAIRAIQNGDPLPGTDSSVASTAN